MKKFLSGAKTAVVLLVVFVLLMGVYGFMMIRPISYGMAYDYITIYEDDEFCGSMTFYTDNTMLIRNTNFDTEIKSFYYFKDGYVFFVLAQTEEEYEEEVATINADFEGAVNSPFYAYKINAVRISSEGPDGYKSVYTCKPAVFLAVAGGIVGLTLIGLAWVSATLAKKTKTENKEG